MLVPKKLDPRGLAPRHDAFDTLRGLRGPRLKREYSGASPVGPIAHVVDHGPRLRSTLDTAEKANILGHRRFLIVSKICHLRTSVTMSTLSQASSRRP